MLGWTGQEVAEHDEESEAGPSDKGKGPEMLEPQEAPERLELGSRMEKKEPKVSKKTGTAQRKLSFHVAQASSQSSEDERNADEELAQIEARAREIREARELRRKRKDQKKRRQSIVPLISTPARRVREALGRGRTGTGPAPPMFPGGGLAQFANPRAPPLPTYAGEPGEDLRAWLNKVATTSALQRWTPEQTATLMIGALQGDASDWVARTDDVTELLDPDMLANALIEAFEPDQSWRAWRALDNIAQYTGETVSVYYQRLKDLTRAADPTMSEAAQFRYFMKGVSGRYRDAILAVGAETLEEALQAAKRRERSTALDQGATTRKYRAARGFDI